jgi:hypothetical protein
MAAPIVTTPAEILETVKAFTNEQRYEIAMNLLTALGGWMGKGRKGRKPKDPSAPKREVKEDSYVSFVNHCVLPHLVALSEKPGLTDAEIKQLKSASCRTQVGSVLWQSVKDSENRLAAFDTITQKKVQEAYNVWKANPPPPKPKKETGAAAGGGEKPKRGRKTAAPAPAEPAEEAEEEETEEETEEVNVSMVDWEHDFGKGMQKYKRMDYEGMTYIYDTSGASRKYLGAYVEKTNKLKPSVKDRLAEYE